MKTERVTLLTTRDFKAFLNSEATNEGVGVAELVRTRCERRSADDESLLAEMTKELRHAVGHAKASLKSGLDEADAVLAEPRSKRAEAFVVSKTSLKPRPRGAGARR